MEKNDNFLYAGIDPSFSNTGIVILDNKYNITVQQLISTKKYDDIYHIEKRMVNIVGFLEDTFIPLKNDLKIVMIEGISFGSKGEGSVQLAALNYFIRIFLLNNEIPFLDIAPKKLKKYITGNGNCQKNLMLKEVYKKWGADFTDDNICDAYCLARYALSTYPNGVSKR